MFDGTHVPQFHPAVLAAQPEQNAPHKAKFLLVVERAALRHKQIAHASGASRLACSFIIYQQLKL